MKNKTHLEEKGTVSRRIGKHKATVRYQERSNGKDRVIVNFISGPLAGVKRERMVSSILNANPTLNPRKILQSVV